MALAIARQQYAEYVYKHARLRMVEMTARDMCHQESRF